MGIRQFVCFWIDDHLIGIDVLMVREINQVLDITPVQQAPEYVRGLANLRGETVTVLDLGVRLGLGLRNITAQSHSVIFKHDLVGLLVDRIGDVEQVEEAEIEPPPANVGHIEREFIEGIVKLRDELLVVLSTERILEYEPAQRSSGT